MATKTIGLDEEAYERLSAEKRPGESFSDAVKRLTAAVAEDWRHSIGKYAADADAFETAARRSRDVTARGLAARQQAAGERLVDHGDDRAPIEDDGDR